MCIQAHFMSSLEGALSLVCSTGTASWLDEILLGIAVTFVLKKREKKRIVLLWYLLFCRIQEGRV